GKTSLLAKLISIEHVKDIADEIKINENSIVPVSIADIQKSSTFPVLLFFQTGYLTIKQQEGTNLVLEIPNTEVCESLMAPNYEGYYHSHMHMLVCYIGQPFCSEDATSKGQNDMWVET
ncbi:17570_t:CDS:2, partial [Entrophospora sp. SA101]